MHPYFKIALAVLLIKIGTLYTVTHIPALIAIWTMCATVMIAIYAKIAIAATKMLSTTDPLLQILYRLDLHMWPNKYHGICAYIAKWAPTEQADDIGAEFLDLVKQWPHYTGEYYFPVPRTSLRECTRCWTGKQGRLRRHLIKWMINYLENENETMRNIRKARTYSGPETTHDAISNPPDVRTE